MSITTEVRSIFVRKAAAAVTALAAGLLVITVQAPAQAATTPASDQTVVTPLTNDWGTPTPLPGN